MKVIWKPIENYEGWYEVGDNLTLKLENKFKTVNT